MAQTLELDDKDLMLKILSKEGTQFCYPYIWLRDNCQCDKCFHPVSKARLVLMMDIDVDVKPKTAILDDKGQRIELQWPDGHTGTYRMDWLRERSFSSEARKSRSLTYKRNPVLWGSEFKEKLPVIDFQKCLGDDVEFYQWMKAIELYGIVLFKNVPTEIGQIAKLCKRVGYIKKTHYGAEFVVKSKRDPSNLAYTGAKLGLHVDQPFYEYAPGIQFLHCLEQYEGDGGDNDFSDGFYVAELIKKQDPNLYKLLTDMPVDFWDVGEDFMRYHKILPRFTFETDQSGELVRINYNNQVRDSFLNVPLDKVRPLYKALKMFDDMMYNNSIRIKLEAGEMISFNNLRVLHGRTAYGANQVGARHLEGGYVDWDELRSTQRVVKTQLNLTD